MFDTSNPQQRERLLVVAAAVVLCVIVAVMLPAQMSEIDRLKKSRENLTEEREKLISLSQSKEEIERRLSTMATQALTTALGGDALTQYNFWLGDLARDTGLRYTSSQAPTPVSAGSIGRNIYSKYGFTINVEGRLEQIAEFLRRFRSAPYLHMIQSFSPALIPDRPGEVKVTFRIEALALPQTRQVNTPEVAEISDDERQMLATIRDRAILWEYTPPRAIPSQQTAQPPRPFNNTPYCFVSGITDADGKLGCWIYVRTTGERFFLFEGESFTLQTDTSGTDASKTVRCTIKKIEFAARRVQIAADGGVYAISVGKNFDQADNSDYQVAIVDAAGQPWTADSTGEPQCEIDYDPENEPAAGKKYQLAEGETFPMKYVTGTVKKIDPANNEVQIEAAGVLYTLKNGKYFSEFADE